MPSLRAWRVRRRRSTGCGSGRGLCCWQRTALRAGRLDERLDVQPARRRSGGFATPGSGLRVWTKRASGALSRRTRQRRTSASWRCRISRRPRAMPAGRHPNVHFHFTPMRASWRNQVEIWFSIPEGKSLHGTSFTSVKQLREHIDAFIKAYNTNATPFAWTKSEVHQKRLKTTFRASMIPGTSEGLGRSRRSQTSVLWGDIFITEAGGFKWLWKLRHSPLDWT